MTASPHPCVVLLAAGQSQRMGGQPPIDKLLLPLPRAGLQKTLLEDRIDAVRGSGLDLVLILPPEQSFPGRWDIARTCGITPVPSPHAHLGIGESLSTAMTHIDDRYDSVLIVLADMPEITSGHMQTVAHTGQSDEIWRGASCQNSSSQNTPGHPVRLPRRLFGRIAQLSGDHGAQKILAGEKIHLIPLPGDAAILDLDTEEDWVRYQQRSCSS
ncbi:nucleotidyltransferase family protein [Aliiroseovarius crassostreae]|uniref:nucleotidyltransferase family protein n=1 Tax=Aliiroseovarius crassostreae TaxID=154981 RepID=UPI002209C721|nr:nucleotidyltransferase family protein [Aliiroseovarius crassostreae]UWP99691.1 nucleotidyltransferase family protein [Aliiroseovarius crassostreae]